jgi:hypothetical protein
MASVPLLLALQIAIIGPEPMRLDTGTSCPTFNLRVNEGVVLARLCSEAAFERRDAEGADTACSVALRQFAELGPDMRAYSRLSAEDQRRCAIESDMARALPAMDFTIAFMQFRQDGSVPMPAPFIPR